LNSPISYFFPPLVIFFPTSNTPVSPTSHCKRPLYSHLLFFLRLSQPPSSPNVTAVGQVPVGSFLPLSSPNRCSKTSSCCLPVKSNGGYHSSFCLWARRMRRCTVQDHPVTNRPPPVYFHTSCGSCTPLSIFLFHTPPPIAPPFLSVFSLAYTPDNEFEHNTWNTLFPLLFFFPLFLVDPSFFISGFKP